MSVIRKCNQGSETRAVIAENEKNLEGSTLNADIL
jgi:hypothetical protein